MVWIDIRNHTPQKGLAYLFCFGRLCTCLHPSAFFTQWWLSTLFHLQQITNNDLRTKITNSLVPKLIMSTLHSYMWCCLFYLSWAVKFWDEDGTTNKWTSLPQFLPCQNKWLCFKIYAKHWEKISSTTTIFLMAKWKANPFLPWCHNFPYQKFDSFNTST